MSLEPLSIDNLTYLVKLVLELWDDCVFEEEYENYKAIIGSTYETCYLAKEQETYIAFVHVSIRTDYVEGAVELPVAYVEGIYVSPSFQQLGVGKKLIAAAEDWARQKGYKQLASDTDMRNAASIDFHTKIGFKEAERIIHFIKDL